MKTKAVPLALLTVFLAANAACAQVFTPPKDWEKKDVPNLKDPAYVGPVDDGFAPNMNLVRDDYKGDLKQFADRNVENLKKVFPNAKVLKQEEFKPGAGAAGIRVITENTVQGKKLKQTFYLFADGDRKFIVTCSQSADGKNLDMVFEESLKTWKIEGK